MSAVRREHSAFSIRRVTTTLAGLVMGLGLAIAAVALWRVDVENGSDMSIDHVTVAVAGQTVFNGSLAVGGVARRRFFVPRETSYSVTVLFSDGSTLTTQVGYLDPLGGFSDRLVIDRGDVRLE